VDASRQFVCIRLATYESQAEADFMKKIYRGRSGELENTTFAILDPTGRKKLTRTGRAPFHEYRDASRMAAGMNEIALRYKDTSGIKLQDAALPLTDSLEIGLNISAADGLPMIVVVAKEESQLKVLRKKVRPLAWSDELTGQFTFAQVTNPKQLKLLTGIKGSPKDLDGILVVRPGQFGLSGKVLKQFDSTTDLISLNNQLVQVVQNFERSEKNHRTHVQQGIRLGIEWESANPETDENSMRLRKELAASNQTGRLAYLKHHINRISFTTSHTGKSS